MKLILTLLALLIPASAFAADSVALSSAVFVERELTDASGRARTELQAPKLVTPGDRLIFILSYHNAGSTPADHFIVTNPLPEAVVYAGTPDQTAVFSIDGGRSWGALSVLKLREDDGRWRYARPEDVTHIRWAMQKAVPVGGRGKFSFRGIVR